MTPVGHVTLLLFTVAWLALLVFWVFKIVEVVRIPAEQFRAARVNQLLWLIVVIVGQIIGALVWQLTRRRSVLAAARGGIRDVTTDEGASP